MVGIAYVRPHRVIASEDFIVEYIKTVLKLNRYREKRNYYATNTF